MKKQLSEKEQLQECVNKISTICRDYNCYIDYDNELNAIIIVDRDTLKFEYYSWNINKKNKGETE